MCRSTDADDAQIQFAANVLRNLLSHIETENSRGDKPFLISHAWTDGPMMYLVYTAPPSDRTWGLVRDTRESIIDPGPWPNLNEAVLYYYLVDFQENQPSSSFRRPNEPGTIWWFGFPREELPERPSDIPERYRHTPANEAPSSKRSQDQDRRVAEPRLYGDPL
ncbi:hypothetical protein [Mycobacterium colombiense]|uniref:hypothetical protein n=1 Tax=Mycobacterium colombiense TaxID=339268 RepID=UPI00096EEF41|nr:hypothetical protein [Mycobacterium colombiense]